VSRLANSLCHILYNQLEQLESMNEHRGEIARWYHEEIATKKVEKPRKLTGSYYVRYPVLVADPGKVMTYFKNRGIILGDWYDTVIGPDDIKLEKTGYVMGSCPVAEGLAARSLNLPTSRKISVKHADKICHMLKTYYDSGETN
ncbi:MAG TPA: DegT/DnrJ/EryC1/StrS family aminotransferase, partial [Candidatus Magasanikbacteria bacterium]|nr:DegT/DnrJ/EryC1/StrS family aminotransferase [Candidatus Magasanikbacteria bacterium]